MVFSRHTNTSSRASTATGGTPWSSRLAGWLLIGLHTKTADWSANKPADWSSLKATDCSLHMTADWSAHNAAGWHAHHGQYLCLLMNPILDTRISFVCSSCSVTLVLPPLKSEKGWTGELWSNRVLLILEN